MVSIQGITLKHVAITVGAVLLTALALFTCNKMAKNRSLNPFKSSSTSTQTTPAVSAQPTTPTAPVTTPKAALSLGEALEEVEEEARQSVAYHEEMAKQAQGTSESQTKLRAYHEEMARRAAACFKKTDEGKATDQARQAQGTSENREEGLRESLEEMDRTASQRARLGDREGFDPIIGDQTLTEAEKDALYRHITSGF